MADISISLKGNSTDLTDFCAAMNYAAVIGKDAQGADIPNPETQTAFCQRKMKEFATDIVKSYRATKDAEAARTASLTTYKDFTF